MSLDDVLELIRCPVCRGPFAREPGRVTCAAGHAFDLARQGYLNLLGRAAPAHADTAAMVAARSRFLGSGAYDPVSDALAGLLPGNAPTLLDVGAGDGHHLARLLARRGGRGVALDISPAACRRAARVPRVGAVVADAWARLPLLDGGFDAVLCVFAPRQPAEFARVLAPQGRLLVVTPQPDHVVELREALQLLDIDADKEDRLNAALAPHFRPEARQEFRSLLRLDADTIHDLVSMGPNAFHQNPDDLSARIAHLRLPHPVTLSVTITAWARSWTGVG